MNNPRPIILGIAKGYSVENLRPFILSLKKTGYTGDVCLFVDSLTPDTLDFLYQHRVQLQPLPTRYFVQTRRHLIRGALNLLPAKFRREAQIELSRYYLHLIDARWACYRGFLRQTRGLYSHVMFTDVKDVVFQRDPFDFEWKAQLCSFLEAPGSQIGNDTPTAGWLQRGYGANEARAFETRRAACAGVTFADIDAAFDLLDKMCDHLIKINSRGLVDQGVYNYLLYNQLLKSSHLYDYADTPVLHLGLTPLGKVKLNEQGLVVNGSGRVVNAIHQYFSHASAMARSLDFETDATA